MTRILPNGSSIVSSSELAESVEAADAPESPETQPAQRRAPRRPRAAVSDEQRDYYVGLARQLAALTGLTDETSICVGLTSCSRGEGVTTVAIHMAAAAAHDLQRPVLLVDANFEAPCAGEACHVKTDIGLADLLLNDALSLEDCLKPGPMPGLQILGPGSPAARHHVKVRSDRMRGLLHVLAQRFGMLVFDLPEATELTACLPIARELNGVVLVVEAEGSRRQAVARAKKQLLQAGADVMGVVFNKRRQHVPAWLYHRL